MVEPGFFFCMLRLCSYLVLHCSGIGLSMFFLYCTSLFLDCKGRLVGVIINTLAPRNFPTSPPEDAAYWPDTQRTPLAKEGTQFFEESWILLHAPKLEHETDYFTSPPKEGMLWIFPAGKIRRLRSGANPRSWVPEASMQTTRPPKPLRNRTRDLMTSTQKRRPRGWLMLYTT
jgi:hypothetical protein